MVQSLPSTADGRVEGGSRSPAPHGVEHVHADDVGLAHGTRVVDGLCDAVQAALLCPCPAQARALVT